MQGKRKNRKKLWHCMFKYRVEGVGGMLLTYSASKRMGSIWPAKMVGATAQYLKSHHIKEEVDHIFGIPECKFKTNPKYYTESKKDTLMPWSMLRHPKVENNSRLWQLKL